MTDPAGCRLFAAIPLKQASSEMQLWCADKAAVQQLTSRPLLVVSQAPASCCCAASGPAPGLHFQQAHRCCSCTAASKKLLP